MEYKENNIFFQLLQASKIIKHTLDDCCKKHGLNLLQLGIIALANEQEMTVSKLAETLDVSKSAISQSLIKLCVKRYVAKKTIDGNKKEFNIVNLPKGVKVKDDLYIVLKNKKEKLDQVMSAEELSTLNNLISKYVQLLREVNEEERG